MSEPPPPVRGSQEPEPGPPPPEPPPEPAPGPPPENVPEKAPEAKDDAPPTRPGENPLRSSRTSSAWAGVIAAGVLLVLLVIFIVQNTESTDIEFLGFDGSLPLAAALLIATAVGIAITAAVGSLRILQLRRRVKREQKRARR